MGTPDNKMSDLVDIVRSWIPRRSEPANVSRDFWMPDQSCRVCYECDSQFTVFNRRHHCRLCGRVFCAKCTTNSIPAPSSEPRSPCIGREDCERVRVCSYCFRLWDQGLATAENGAAAPTGGSPGLSPSPSAASLASSKSSLTGQSSTSTAGSVPYSTGPYQHVPHNSALNPHQSFQMDLGTVHEGSIASQRSINLNTAMENTLPNQYNSFCCNRSDDEDDDYGPYHSDTHVRNFSQTDGYFGAAGIDIDQVYGPYNNVHPDEDNTDAKSSECSLSPENYGVQSETMLVGEEAVAHDHEASPYELENTNSEAVDFENNGLLWIPPEPEDEEDDREVALFDDDEEECGSTGEWGYLRSSNSFGSGEYRNKEKSSEEHRNAMKNVVEGHFKALVAQLLQVENLPVGDDNDRESWLEIVTSLSWKAATLLKPDTSKGGGMDPGGYVKVKCIASGRRSESMVVKGVVCKKNVAHRRMTSRVEKPRFLILGGALEYQRVSNLLSSFDTLLQQEMDHLKMAVAKIDAHQPDVLLVEKSVSRHAQEYLLEKNISLVLNIKRPLLDRIARCTGAQVVSSIDHLTSLKLGYCDLFHVEKFYEEHGSAAQDGKKLIKTLMFFEGCPKPLGCTVLLRGACGDELKKVKHVVQYGVFAAYHLALETSFLADEGASIPELPLKSPITVALPDKPSGIERSISTVPGFNAPPTGKSMHNEAVDAVQRSNKATNLEDLSINCKQSLKSVLDCSPSYITSLQSPNTSVLAESIIPISTVGQDNFDCSPNQVLPIEHINGCGPEKLSNSQELVLGSNLVHNSFGNSELVEQGNCSGHADGKTLVLSNRVTLDSNQEVEPLKEEFPPSPSDNQSILVSLSTRCVWKGTVCDRAHLLRIKYYGNFDKPLGRFLRDHLFDQSYLCRSCGMPSEAHVHCYTHRQGSLTISVKKLPEFLLPGEKEGKIWMWHRCLKCRRTSGFPPATRRVVMSDAAWGLSFGKFLELSFSNHAAASRVASCGHSLHRDCLRFYGFGRMVACFRYASIDVLSVYLPPPKLEFYYANQEWIQKEANEVHKQAELLFTEVQNALHQISEKTAVLESHNTVTRGHELRQQVAELEEMLREEKKEFEESLQKAICGEVKVGQPEVDILEINKLRRRILFHSYVWDQRLINVSSLNNNSLPESLGSSTPKLKEKSVSSVEKFIESVPSKPAKSFSSHDSFLLEARPDLSQLGNSGQIFHPDGSQNGNEIGPGQSFKEESKICLSSGKNIDDKCDEESVRMAHSDGEYPVVADLSDTLDAAWTGEYPSSINAKEDGYLSADSTVVKTVTATVNSENHTLDQGKTQVIRPVASAIPLNGRESLESSTSLVTAPLTKVSSSLLNLSFGSQKLTNGDYNPIYVSLFRELERQSGARLLLPVGVNDTIVPVYDDEPTSIIAYTLVSSEYHLQMSETEKPKDALDSSISLPIFDSLNLLSLNSFDESVADTYRNFGSGDESILSTSTSRGSQAGDRVIFSKDLHARITFTDDGPLGKVKYTVTCYYAKCFEALRRMCCPSELDFVRSLSRCKKWGAQGGKSKVFFAKTLDDRFIIKQVTKTELESFIKFGPAYFKYLTESISTGSPTCLAKILGIYQVSSKHVKGGKESKMDVLVMENLLFRRSVTRLYDLKGSARSRYNPDTSGSNKVLLDQNLIEAMPTSPIFVGNKAKRSLERAVWNDTSFLASIDVMDYSLLVGVDEERHELVLGIIDFMRQYTWDKHLETWVKTSGFLGGPKNAAPTVISPQQYKKRFRKAMTTYFLMVPDQWFPATIVPSRSQSELCEENVQGGSFDR